MSMMINTEKEPSYRIRAGHAGKPKKIQYATLNIMRKYAQGQIKSQINVYGQEDEEKLQKLYARMVSMPGIAYLRQDGFGGEFHENALINGLIRETLSKCIYVGPLGAPEEIRTNFICQEGLCTCRHSN